MQDETIFRLTKAISAAIGRDIVVAGPAGLGALSFDELGLDSVAVLSALVAVEDEFNIEFSDETPPGALRSLGTLADYLEHAFLHAA